MRFRLTLATVIAVALAFAVLVLVPRVESRPAPPVLEGAVLPGIRAPSFALQDQFGKSVTSASLRGHPTVVTFMESHCAEQCPLVTDKIRLALNSLASSRAKVSVVAISTDPEGDTKESVRRFSVKSHMWFRWHYLTGSRRILQSIWAAYYVFVPPAGSSQQLQGAHTSATYLLDSHGRERVLLASDPDLTALTRDLRIIAGLPPDRNGERLTAPRQDDLAPAFSLADLRNDRVTLQSFRGKVVLLNFWASDCPPCRQEMKLLSAANRRWSGRSFAVVGIDKGEDARAVTRFVDQQHPSYRILLDRNGTTSSMYDIYALPWSLVIDGTGVVRSVHAGILDPKYLRQQVLPLLR